MSDRAQTVSNVAVTKSDGLRLSCPFCGSEADDQLVDVLVPAIQGADFYGVRCGACGAAAPQDVWPRRVCLDAVLLTIERLASRISGNPCAHEIDKANASGILEFIRRSLSR